MTGRPTDGFRSVLDLSNIIIRAQLITHLLSERRLNGPSMKASALCTVRCTVFQFIDIAGVNFQTEAKTQARFGPSFPKPFEPAVRYV